MPGLIDNPCPATLAARLKRRRRRAEAIAAGWVDKRFGKSGEAKTPSSNVAAWRKRHRAKAQAMDRVYKGLKRSPLFIAMWPTILAHYGGKCLNPSCKHPDMPVYADHVLSVMESPQERNCLYNLQPLCVPCNSSKGDDPIDYRPDGGAFCESLPSSHDCLHPLIHGPVESYPRLAKPPKPALSTDDYVAKLLHKPVSKPITYAVAKETMTPLQFNVWKLERYRQLKARHTHNEMTKSGDSAQSVKHNVSPAQSLIIP